MSHLVQFINECHSNLVNGRDSETDQARKYLSNRYVKPDTMAFHKIGYCYKKQDIPDEVKFYGKNLDNLTDKGYAYFMAGRIIVPVYSEFGIAVGLATRKPSSEPGNTWWNLPNPFKKGEHLFLLNKTRKDIFRNNKVFIVEGYMDAIILHQEGLREVVAIMGTSLSPRKIGLIARYCDNITLCLDVDANMSGQKGQDKAIYALREFDFYDSISVIDGLPVGEDPDVFVIQHGLNDLLCKEKKLTQKEIDIVWKKIKISTKR